MHGARDPGYNCRNMKRLFLIFLLAMLPLQLSWGAVTVYCQHEQGKAAQHLGHHVHKHHPSSADKQEKGGKFKADGDCGYCHLTCLKLACTNQIVLVPTALPPHVAYEESAFHSFIPQGPPRPNWFAVS